MATALKFIYSLSLTFWIGSIFFFSMFAAPSIFKVLTREQAGNVVSDIFPKYYMVSYICGAVALVSSIALIYFWNSFSSAGSIIRIAVLFLMLGLAVYAGEINRPQAHAVRTEMRSVGQDSPEYEKIHKEFRRLHRTSAITNGVIFILGIALVFLSAYTNKD
jgi:uncharacterized membrane protein